MSVRVGTRGDAFSMTVNGRQFTERKRAGAALLGRLRQARNAFEEGPWTVGHIGGLELRGRGRRQSQDRHHDELWLERTGMEQDVELSQDLTPLGLISRLEYMLDRFEVELAEQRRRLREAEQRLPGYRQRIGEVFALQDELEAKEAELAALEADLAANDNRGDDEEPAEEEAA